MQFLHILLAWFSLVAGVGVSLSSGPSSFSFVFSLTLLLAFFHFCCFPTPPEGRLVWLSILPIIIWYGYVFRIGYVPFCAYRSPSCRFPLWMPRIVRVTLARFASGAKTFHAIPGVWTSPYETPIAV